MKFGFSIFPLLAYPSSMIEAARKAEEVGFESLYTPDHLLFPMEMPNTYPYAADGRSPVRSGEGPRFDAWALLSHLAAVTKTIRLGTNVYILPLRDPLAVARSVATLDQLSDGRTLFGVGVGWLEQEFEMIGRDFRTRGAVTDEAIAFLRQVWTQPVTAFNGKYLSYPPIKMEPKPVQQPPPIYIGGTSAPAIRRAARLGDGWMSTGDSFESTKAKVDTLRQLLNENDRGHVSFSITASGADVNPGGHAIDTVRRYEEIGVDRLIVSPMPMREETTPEAFIAGLERMGDLIGKVG